MQRILLFILLGTLVSCQFSTSPENKVEKAPVEDHSGHEDHAGHDHSDAPPEIDVLEEIKEPLPADPILARTVLYDQTLQIHDLAMAEMGNLNLAGQWTASALTSATAQKKEDIIPVLTELNSKIVRADKKMWDWMHNFKHPKNEEANDKVIPYLEGERAKALEVHKLIKNAIAETDSIKEALTVIQAED